MILISRADWGARAPRNRTVGKLNKVSVCHWNGPTITFGGSLTWPHSNCYSLVKGIQNYHMDNNGWADIAYNFLVCPHGVVFEGRGINVVNAANGTTIANRSNHAICCLAGVSNPFSVNEKSAFKECVEYISDKVQAPNNCIGHGDIVSTDCPGLERLAWVRQDMPVDGSSPLGGLIFNGAMRAQGGYALVGSDGGVFCYEDAPYYGSIPELHISLAAPIVSMCWTRQGDGYWLMGEDGGIFPFGAAQFLGSYPGLQDTVKNDPNRKFSVVMARTNGGYTEVSTTREFYNF